MKRTMFALLSCCLLCTACSTRHAVYTVGGTAIGAGVGYSQDHDDKEAAIGGLVGGATGMVVGHIEHRLSKKKYKSGYEKGYKQAQVDIASQYWKDTTEKRRPNYVRSPQLKKFKVSEQKINDVMYDEHYVVLEDYR